MARCFLHLGRASPSIHSLHSDLSLFVSENKSRLQTVLRVPLARPWHFPTSAFSSPSDVSLLLPQHMQRQSQAARLLPSHPAPRPGRQHGVFGRFWTSSPSSASPTALLKGGCMTLIVFLVFRTENILCFFKNVLHLVSVEGSLWIYIDAASFLRVWFLLLLFSKIPSRIDQNKCLAMVREAIIFLKGLSWNSLAVYSLSFPWELWSFLLTDAMLNGSWLRDQRTQSFSPLPRSLRPLHSQPAHASPFPIEPEPRLSDWKLLLPMVPPWENLLILVPQCLFMVSPYFSSLKLESLKSEVLKLENA